MKRPRFKITKVIQSDRYDPTSYKVTYILKEHLFWFFYYEIKRSAVKDSLVSLMNHLKKIP